VRTPPVGQLPVPSPRDDQHLAGSSASATVAPPPVRQLAPTLLSSSQAPPLQFIVPQPKPTRMKNLTNHLPPLNGPNSRQVELFANGGNYGSSRPSNRVGGFQDRYAPNSLSRFTPYDVCST
jgi:hypothetical protein